MSNSLNIHDVVNRVVLVHTNMHGENKRCIACCREHQPSIRSATLADADLETSAIRNDAVTTDSI